MGSCPAALFFLWALWAVGWPSALLAQVPPPDPAKALEKVNAHIAKVNELGKKLKDRMRAGFPPVKDRNEALQIVEETFCDIVRFKAHYELAHAHGKRTGDRDNQRMRVRGMKNAYFPGDFFDYLPLIERLQKHVERFHVPVNPIEWYTRYKKSVEADMALLQREFESDPAAGKPSGVAIWDAMDGKLVEAAIAGDDRVTSRIKLLIRNLSGKKLTVTVPVWTAAIPTEEGKQIMLTREPIEIVLEPEDSQTVDCPAVCADLRTKERPAQNFCPYRFGAYPGVRDLAAAQNIIGIVDIAEVKGRYSSLGIPTAIRSHLIAQLGIWRYLARAHQSEPADITKDTPRYEIPLQLGQHPDQLPPDQAKALMEHGPEILKKMDEALQRLDI